LPARGTSLNIYRFYLSLRQIIFLIYFLQPSRPKFHMLGLGRLKGSTLTFVVKNDVYFFDLFRIYRLDRDCRNRQCLRRRKCFRPTIRRKNPNHFFMPVRHANKRSLNFPCRLLCLRAIYFLRCVTYFIIYFLRCLM
jgi:hypothetical protein